jgi:hypothetical protein
MVGLHLESVNQQMLGLFSLSLIKEVRAVGHTHMLNLSSPQHPHMCPLSLWFSKVKAHISLMCWCTPIILALRRLRQEDGVLGQRRLPVSKNKQTNNK